MRPTYAHIELLMLASDRQDRAPAMPLLGFLAGLAIALPLWSGLAWLAWAILG